MNALRVTDIQAITTTVKDVKIRGQTISLTQAQVDKLEPESTLATCDNGVTLDIRPDIFELILTFLSSCACCVVPQRSRTQTR